MKLSPEKSPERSSEWSPEMLSKKGTRSLAKHGGRPRVRWWDSGFVVGLSGGGSFWRR